MTNELIEAMARAHDREQAAQMGEPSPWGFDDLDPEWIDCRMVAMREAIAAAKAAGYRLVPVEPTPEMMAAYHRASIAPVSSLSLHGYRAMLAAAPDHVEQVRPMVGDHVADASKMVKEVGRD